MTTEPSEDILFAEGLTKEVPIEGATLTILKDVDIAIKRGGAAAIVGESGSGKTTLLGLLAGLDVPTKGQIWLDGDEISNMSEDARAQVRARAVGFVFQNFQLIESLTALENVMLPSELRGDKTARQDALDYLDRVGLADRVKHYPRQLSGGEQQRVAIARAFSSKPKVLFADEPTGNLDTKTGRRVADLLFDLNHEHDTTLVLVTHDKTLAERCQVRTELAAGSVIA